MVTTHHDADELTGDLLSRVEVVVCCNICQASYAIPGSMIRESQRLLAEGCTGTSLFECDASFYATLIEPEVIANLERAWASFQQSATSHGGIGVALVGAESNTLAVDPDARALQRWENEGGRCNHAHAALDKSRDRSEPRKSKPDADPRSPRAS